MKYRPEIDGLRSVAVIPVILFHAGFNAFKGGFVGVDIFFVISGYLITSIILEDIDNKKFSIGSFYERRARRILPALYTVIIICIPFSVLWMTPERLYAFSKSVIAVLFFVSNIQFYRESGYFDLNSEEKPLLHTWSLAVEEQYYIFFPILMVIFWRWGWRSAAMVVATLCGFSLLFSEFAWRYAPSANFFLLPSRAWELLSGSLCAFLQYRRIDLKSAWLSVIGFLMIAYSVFVFDEKTPFPSFYTIVPVLGTSLIIVCCTTHDIVGKILSSAPLVGIGLISYSAYLWHQPLFSFARIQSDGATDKLLMILLSIFAFVLAFFTWKFIETPFRSRGTVPIKRFAAIFASCAFALLLAGVTGAVTKGNERLWLAAQDEATANIYRLLQRAKHEDADQPRERGECIFNTSNFDIDFIARVKNCYDKFGAGYLILGDSHAIDLFGVATSGNNSIPFIVGLTSGGCRPHDINKDYTCRYYDQISDFIAGNSLVFRKIVFEQAGFYLLMTDQNNSGTRSMFSNVRLSDPIAGIYSNNNAIKDVAHYLDKLANFTDVVWLLPRVEPHISPEQILRNGCKYSYSLRPNQIDVFKDLEHAIRINLQGKKVRSISQNDAFNFDMGTDFLNCKELYWSDGDHFTLQGEALFGKRYNVLLER